MATLQPTAPVTHRKFDVPRLTPLQIAPPTCEKMKCNTSTLVSEKHVQLSSIPFHVLVLVFIFCLFVLFLTFNTARVYVLVCLFACVTVFLSHYNVCNIRSKQMIKYNHICVRNCFPESTKQKVE